MNRKHLMAEQSSRIPERYLTKNIFIDYKNIQRGILRKLFKQGFKYYK